jgi:hypothetical protein
MSFSDMMSSGRGPGVIGMVLALIVLLGFGVLFLFATDERFQGADLSIEAVIARQSKEIEESQRSIGEGQKLLNETPIRVRNSKEMTKLARESATLTDRISALGREVESSKNDLLLRKTAFEAYKDQYRAYVRGKAKGETMETLETASGTVYRNVNIREVTAVGIQIRHDDGQKRIPFEDLSEAMKEQFQFDPQQKVAAIAKEENDRSEHEAAVASADLVTRQKIAAQTDKDADLQREKIARAITINQARIVSLTDEIEALSKAIPLESEKRISRAPQLRAQLANKQSELSSLRISVARLQSGQ